MEIPEESEGQDKKPKEKKDFYKQFK